MQQQDSKMVTILCQNLRDHLTHYDNTNRNDIDEFCSINDSIGIDGHHDTKGGLTVGFDKKEITPNKVKYSRLADI